MKIKLYSKRRIINTPLVYIMTTFDEELNIINSIDIFETYHFNCEYCGEHSKSYKKQKFCDECKYISKIDPYFYSDPYYTDCSGCGKKYHNSDSNYCFNCEEGYVTCVLCASVNIDDDEYDDDLIYIYNSEYIIKYTCNKCFNKNFKLNYDELVSSNYITRYIMIISIIQRWWKDIYYHPDNKLAKELSKNFIKYTENKI